MPTRYCKWETVSGLSGGRSKMRTGARSCPSSRRQSTSSPEARTVRASTDTKWMLCKMGHHIGLSISGDNLGAPKGLDNHYPLRRFHDRLEDVRRSLPRGTPTHPGVALRICTGNLTGRIQTRERSCSAPRQKADPDAPSIRMLVPSPHCDLRLHHTVCYTHFFGPSCRHWRNKWQSTISVTRLQR